MFSQPRPLVGIDIGGTRIKAGVTDTGYRSRLRVSAPMPSGHEPTAVAAAAAELARKLLASAGHSDEQLQRVGVGVPGRVDPRTGVVRSCVNLIGWDNVPLGDLIAGQLGVPALVQNDANVAAYAEYVTARQHMPTLRNAVLLTLGTGVGGGVVIDGRVLVGANQFAGEIGHMIVAPGGRSCPCGQTGCLEQYASAPALVSRARQNLRELIPAAAGSHDPYSNLKTEQMTAQDVFAMAAVGNSAANDAIEEAAMHLAIACVNIARMLDVDAIFLGGGMSEAGEQLIGRVRAAFELRTWSIAATHPLILPAKLGNDAGWVGAAALTAEG